MKMGYQSQVLTAILCTTKLGGALIVQYFLFRNLNLFLHVGF
jgi:hypothetical protein